MTKPPDEPSGALATTAQGRGTPGHAAHEHPLDPLRGHTPARIALGRIGASQPTQAVLAFSMAHARARDAVHLPYDSIALANSFAQAGFATLQVHSMAADRATYLKRPDLGRTLHPECAATLRIDHAPSASRLTAGRLTAGRLTVVVADGLSALAPARHAVPMVLAIQNQLQKQLHAQPQHWTLDTIILASQARVALADAVGALRQAEAVVILIGERPGLSSPDSLGLYVTYAPRPGLTDAERNCISNVRAEGLSYSAAAYTLHYLLEQARAAGTSGVAIKDHSAFTAELAPRLGKLTRFD